MQKSMSHVINRLYNEHPVDAWDEYRWAKKHHRVERIWPNDSEHILNRLRDSLLVSGQSRGHDRRLLLDHLFGLNKLPDYIHRSLIEEARPFYRTDDDLGRRRLEGWIKQLRSFQVGLRECVRALQGWENMNAPEGILHGISKGHAKIYTDEVAIWVFEISFDVDECVIDTRRAHRYVAPTEFHIYCSVDEESEELVFERVIGSSLNGQYVNPHILSGHGGTACLGGYGLEVNRAIAEKDWLSVMLILRAFHQDYDPHDAWGATIERFPKVWYLDTSEGTTKVISTNAGVEGFTPLRDMLKKGYYMRGQQIVSHKDYVRCAVTGKLIKRENATRVPKYISDEGLTLLSQNGYSSMKKSLSPVDNQWDQEKFEEAIERAWKKKNKRNIAVLHERALFEEESLKRLLDDLNTLTLEGHINRSRYSHLVYNGVRERLQRRRERAAAEENREGNL